MSDIERSPLKRKTEIFEEVICPFLFGFFVVGPTVVMFALLVLVIAEAAWTYL